MSGVSFTVLGTPAPQGSKSPWGTESNPATRPWRATVAAEAYAAMDGAVPLDGPLLLDLMFRMPRPKGHYRSGRYAQELKPSSPFWCSKTPDVDKLIRAVGDALTTAGVWRDDSQVTLVHARKAYASLTDLPGVEIHVHELDVLLEAVRLQPEHPKLFHADGESNDPAVPRCSAPYCQAGSRRSLCKYEADRAHGVGYGRSRPLGCLLGHDPRTAPFPAGY